MKYVLFVLMILFAVACSNSQGSADQHRHSDSVITSKTGWDIEPKLQKADSMQIIYYDDPEGDSLRYTRFFTYVNSTETSVIVNNLNTNPVRKSAPRQCRSAGKMYLYEKNNVIKTIYFSLNQNTCSYLYFIKDGVFYYFPLLESARQFLNENAAMAVKP